MKKLFVVLVLLAAIAAPTFVGKPARAETIVRTCTQQYGGGEVCGETTIEEHPAREVEAGITDLQLWQVIMLTGGVAAVATVFYKVSYRLYIFDR